MPSLNDDGAPRPISLDDWKTAVCATANVRLCGPDPHSVTNSNTGDAISFLKRDGGVDVYFPDENTWRPVFRWFDGAAHVNARFEPGDRSCPVWTAMVALASRLGAAVRGDDGETYDLQTGEVNDAL